MYLRVICFVLCHGLDCISIDLLFSACVGESELPGWLVENEQFNALIAEAEKLVGFSVFSLEQLIIKL